MNAKKWAASGLRAGRHACSAGVALTLLLPAPFALAKSPRLVKPIELLVPVEPRPGDSPVVYTTWVVVPAVTDAAWVSSYAPLQCKLHQKGVQVSMSLDPKAWPYELPPTATCTDGATVVEVRLGFRTPEPSMWVATDGTVVVPYRSGEYKQSTLRLPGAPLVAAESDAAAKGVSCEANDAGMLVVKVEGGAVHGTATCRLTAPGSQARDQRVVLVAY